MSGKSVTAVVQNIAPLDVALADRVALFPKRDLTLQVHVRLRAPLLAAFSDSVTGSVSSGTRVAMETCPGVSYALLRPVRHERQGLNDQCFPVPCLRVPCLFSKGEGTGRIPHELTGAFTLH